MPHPLGSPGPLTSIESLGIQHSVSPPKVVVRKWGEIVVPRLWVGGRYH